MEHLAAAIFACSMVGTSHAQLLITDSLSGVELAELLEGLGVTIPNVDVQCDPSAFGRISGVSELPWRKDW